MRTANNLDQYREAWQAHIANLAALALAANVTYDEYVAVKNRLLEWVDDAIQNFRDKDEGT